MTDGLYLLYAFLAVLALIPLVRVLALKIGYVDEPGGRKHHDMPVPPIGGIVIFPVFIALAWLTGFNTKTDLYFYTALIMIMLVGAIDDYRHVPAWVKFFSQIAAACLLIWAGPAHVFQLGDLFGLGEFKLSFMSWPFSLAAIVLFINAINLMDGLDGLAAGIGLIICGWLIYAAMAGGQADLAFQPALLASVLLGFLVYNARAPWRKKASVFLGDAGSLGLGLCIAWLAIGLTQEPRAVLQPMSLAWIIALPIIDVCAQFYRRVREGRHPFDPDRGHFHHHLIHAGFSVKTSVIVIYACMLITGAFGVLAYRAGLPLSVLTLSWIALILIHMRISRDPDHYIRFFRRFSKAPPVDN